MISDITRTLGLIHVQYSTQEALCKAFARFQEHYENPEFREKVFTLGQLREWYCKKRGSWSYYSDWNGFNFPSYVLNAFKAGSFDPLSPEERELFERLRYIPGKFYVIGTHGKGDAETLEHEKMHALYYFNDAYRKEIDSFLELTYPAKLSPLKNHLRELGYHEDVIQDEVHAYLGSSTGYLEEEGIEYPKEAADWIRAVFKKYRGEL